MITVDRAEAREYIEELYDETIVVTEAHIDLFIEYVEIYALSERMLEDYMDDNESPMVPV